MDALWIRLYNGTDLYKSNIWNWSTDAGAYEMGDAISFLFQYHDVIYEDIFLRVANKSNRCGPISSALPPEGFASNQLLNDRYEVISSVWMRVYGCVVCVDVWICFPQLLNHQLQNPGLCRFKHPRSTVLKRPIHWTKSIRSMMSRWTD